MSNNDKNRPQASRTPGAQRPGGHGGPGGGPMAHMPGAKAKNFSATIRRLIQYSKKHWIAISTTVLFAILSTIFSIIGPLILGQATTIIFSTAKTGVDFAAIGRQLLILLALYIASSIFAYVQGFAITGVAQKITYKLRQDISKKMDKLPVKYFDNQTHGEVLSRVTNDVDTVAQTLNQSLAQMITSVVTIVGIVAMMFWVSWIMSLVALIMVPLSFWFMKIVIGMSQKHFKKQQMTLGELNGHVEEMYSAHNVVKAFNGEKRSIDKFKSINKKLYGSAWKAQFLSGLMFPAINFIGNLGYVAICILGGVLVMMAQPFYIGFLVIYPLQVGYIQSFIQYVRSFTQPISQVSNIANVMQSTAAAAERVFEFLDEEEETKESVHPVKLESVKGNVEFSNVKFGYNEDKIIINDFSAQVMAGQQVAIVGPTGAGKTTIVKLLMRYYDVNSGCIAVDGVDIREFLREDLRGMFAMVLQDTWLFNGSIMENIRYGRPDATDEEVIAAAKAASVDHFVHTLPGGYSMEINEEASNISQGQKQLLTIARAILANPPMLILDEATSSVDTRTEVLIQSAMKNLMANRTSFVIAHRLSTIRYADLILVMDNGDIIEKGSHSELMEQDGFYASLYNSQFESSAVS